MILKSNPELTVGDFTWSIPLIDLAANNSGSALVAPHVSVFLTVYDRNPSRVYASLYLTALPLGPEMIAGRYIWGTCGWKKLTLPKKTRNGVNSKSIQEYINKVVTWARRIDLKRHKDLIPYTHDPIP